eukprot:g19594.t1
MFPSPPPAGAKKIHFGCGLVEEASALKAQASGCPASLLLPTSLDADYLLEEHVSLMYIAYLYILPLAYLLRGLAPLLYAIWLAVLVLGFTLFDVIRNISDIRCECV